MIALPHIRKRAQRGKPRPFGIVAILSASSSIAVIEVLHNHTCTGGDCTFCLIVACAWALLALSVGAVLARPLARIVAKLYPANNAKPLDFVAMLPTSCASMGLRTHPTLVSLGVELLI